MMILNIITPPPGNGLDGEGEAKNPQDGYIKSMAALPIAITEDQLDIFDAFAAYADGFAIFEAYLI